MGSKKSGALAHLTHLYDDSDAESDLDESSINENRNTDVADYTSDPNSMELQQSGGTDEQDEEIQDLQEKQKETATFRPVSPTTFHLKLQDIQSPEEIKIPPPPPGQPPEKLVDKITGLHQRMQQKGLDMKASIEKRKDFCNPSIYEKLIVFCDIDELGTNYPRNIYDPHRWGPEAFYDKLAFKQKEEMEKKEKEKRDKTKVEFVSGTAKRNREIETRKKSKWDVSSSTSGAGLPPTTLPTTITIPTTHPQ